MINALLINHRLISFVATLPCLADVPLRVVSARPANKTYVGSETPELFQQIMCYRPRKDRPGVTPRSRDFQCKTCGVYCSSMGRLTTGRSIISWSIVEYVVVCGPGSAQHGQVGPRSVVRRTGTPRLTIFLVRSLAISALHLGIVVPRRRVAAVYIIMKRCRLVLYALYSSSGRHREEKNATNDASRTGRASLFFLSLLFSY